MKVGHRRDPAAVPSALLEEPAVGDLEQWGSRLAEEGLSPGESGNLSCRTPGGFLITRTQVPLGAIQRDDWVLVTGIEHAPDGRVIVDSRGRHDPSRDAAVHAAIYRYRPEADVVFHLHVGHLDELRELGVPSTTTYHRAGTRESMEEIERFLAAHPGAAYFNLTHHAIVALGTSAEETGARVESYQQGLAKGG
jgi:ribulose-5-phosphate 4-epimerase/fuculose-1-phosphate aldolase